MNFAHVETNCVRASGARLAALLAPLLVGACGALPAVLDPQGSNARETAQIAWVLFIGAGVIFACVIVFTACAVFAAPRRRTWLGRQSFVVGAGIVFPIIALSALLIYTLQISGGLAQVRAAAPLPIRIVGEMWWWRVHYTDATGAPAITTANEVHVPVGRPVEFSLESADVLHSFWIPNLSGKLDLIPGRTNVLRVTADKPGVFRGQCAEYCGAQHAKMALYVIALPAPEFDAWLAAEQLPGAAPQTPELTQGLALFVAHCSACHTVRGTPAAGRLGPDLTHVGSRRSLAAGVLPNNVGTIAGWIAASQHIKPENRMPSFDRFTGDELRALAGYVESLR